MVEERLNYPVNHRYQRALDIRDERELAAGDRERRFP